MTRTSNDRENKHEWLALRRWQETYSVALHGPVERDEWLDLETFHAGGIRGHEAPRCFKCDPEIDDARD